ncbi:hypothetical protein Tco_1265601 [Tanacetum coccineum]
MNVEYCGWSMLIKYLFKYISKGIDRIFARVTRPIGEPSTEAGPSRPPIDEIHNYLEGWFICAHKAYWRILKFDIHYREPEELVARRNSKSSIGRLAYVHPTSGELFFLQMLLCYQKGCRDFWEVQTLKGIFYPTYRAACEALGLLGDDKECDIAIQEACASATPAELRSLFAHILLHFDVTDPSKLWTKYWKEMNRDMLEKVSQTVQIPGYHLNDDGLQGYTLYEIEVVLNNCGKLLQNFGLSPPPEGLLA